MACTDFLIKISHLNRKTKQRSKDFKHEDRDYSEHGIFQSQFLLNSKTEQITSKEIYITKTMACADFLITKCQLNRKTKQRAKVLNTKTETIASTEFFNHNF